MAPRFSKGTYKSGDTSLEIDRTSKNNFKIENNGKEVANLKFDRRNDNASLIYLSNVYSGKENLEILKVFNQFLNHNSVDLGQVQTIETSFHKTRPSTGFPREMGENIVAIKRRTHNLFVTERERDEMLIHGLSISGSYSPTYGNPYRTNVNNKENIIIDGSACKFILDGPDDLKGKNILFITDKNYVQLDFFLSSKFDKPVSFPNIQVHDMNSGRPDNISLFISERTKNSQYLEKTEFDFSDLDANISDLTIRSAYSKMEALFFSNQDIAGRVRSLETLKCNPIISREEYRNSVMSINGKLGLDDSDVPVNDNNATDMYTAKNYVDTMKEKLELLKEMKTKTASIEQEGIK